ncbi:nitric oxide-associated protein 1-like isoform X2 [Stylophora pistillata]|uniref:nitric oxide-associated protein 1-like isoform X2 n=1 Tax=Stylophora pistillata TaxID=50429 RepID=UPI000C03B99C|nr:nitric oxide-associated protein 1-like isoform X2 [Stylophora pistillata]
MSMIHYARLRGLIWRVNRLNFNNLSRNKHLSKVVTSRLHGNVQCWNKLNLFRRSFRASALLHQEDSDVDEKSPEIVEGTSGISPTGVDLDTIFNDESSLADLESSKVESVTDVYEFEQPIPKCLGCGAAFQSEDPAQGGYVMFSKNPVTGDKNPVSEWTARTLVCQKCFNLKHYNEPFPITITSSEIMEYLGNIERRKGLILYVVDMMDLPGSLFPNLLQTVGETKRIIIVGNKADMLPVEGTHTGKQEQHLREVLLKLCQAHGLQGANIKSMCLISAKTGYGITQLVSKISEHWDDKGDIYLIGCSNTGKTSLFNLLLDLFSVHKNADLLQRATVSLWPCTTQRMIRFPIGHMMLRKLLRRMHEGVYEKPDDVEYQIDDEIISKEETSYREKMKKNYIGKGSSTALVPSQTGLDLFKPSFVMYEPNTSNKNQRWLYDTPGIISEHQITNLLTMEELRRLNPKLWFVPRTFILKPGFSLLLGGLARVDYLQIKRRSPNGEWDAIPKAIESVFFTVVASPNLPVHICSEERAVEVYDKHAETELLGIPVGGKERMETFPPLGSQEFTIKGIGWDASAADVVLSNVGWVAVTAGNDSLVTLEAHTPNAIGLHVRQPPLLPTSVRARGNRGVKYQGHISRERYEATRKRNPQFITKARRLIPAESQWVEEITIKRKQQRLLFKVERRKREKEYNLLEGSAVSDPPNIPGASWLPLPRRKLEDAEEEEEELNKLTE